MSTRRLLLVYLALAGIGACGLLVGSALQAADPGEGPARARADELLEAVESGRVTSVTHFVDRSEFAWLEGGEPRSAAVPKRASKRLVEHIQRRGVALEEQRGEEARVPLSVFAMVVFFVCSLVLVVVPWSLAASLVIRSTRGERGLIREVALILLVPVLGTIAYLLKRREPVAGSFIPVATALGVASLLTFGALTLLIILPTTSSTTIEEPSP